MTKRFSIFKAALVLLCAVLLCLFPLYQGGNVTARANSDVIEIQKFATEMTIRTDRTVAVKESITVKFLENKRMFYRSLPMEGAQYSNIHATCKGNSAFYFEVASNPDVEGFLDINCIGAADYGKVWTYDISYIMEGNTDMSEGITIDVVPFGFTVPLHDVSVKVHFPVAIAEADYATYVGFGSEEKNPQSLQRELSADGKTLTLSADLLRVHYNSSYDEYVADGVTLDVIFPEGTIESFTTRRMFTEDIPWIIIVGVVVIAAAVVVLQFARKKRELITVVNVKAPDQLDPMYMGKLLDGTVDKEDLTSMIYYFAQKGYLSIDLSDEDDPLLIQNVEYLPDSSAPYERTIFYGLFQYATRETIVSDDPFEENKARVTIRTSELKERFYISVEKAIKQVPPVKMYEKTSIWGYVGGGLLGLLLMTIVPFIMGLSLHGTYTYLLGVTFVIPAALILLIGYYRENYRYKWKSAAYTGILVAEIVIAVLYALIFTFFFAQFFMTEYEKFVLCACALAALFITMPCLSRTQKYLDTLGQILGFKEFIVVTEEDKIKFMLEENPELYYKVLPYAQVLGVTKEWTDKFEAITIAPPSWCTGTDLDFFDFWIINRCMTRAMLVAMMPPQQKGGSFTGMSGGGGSFGGFGGGGFGGGGGGAR